MSKSEVLAGSPLASGNSAACRFPGVYSDRVLEKPLLLAALHWCVPLQSAEVCAEQEAHVSYFLSKL